MGDEKAAEVPGDGDVGEAGWMQQSQRPSAWGAAFLSRRAPFSLGQRLMGSSPFGRSGVCGPFNELLNLGGREARRTSPSVSSAPKGPGLGQTNVSEAPDEQGAQGERMHQEMLLERRRRRGKRRPLRNLTVHLLPGLPGVFKHSTAGGKAVSAFPGRREFFPRLERTGGQGCRSSEPMTSEVFLSELFPSVAPRRWLYPQSLSSCLLFSVPPPESSLQAVSFLGKAS